jgi:hypothetical protein
MSINRNPIFPEVPTADCVQIANADGTTVKTLSTPGSNGRNITAIVATSNDTAAVVLNLSILKGGITYPLCQVTVPIGAGTSAAKPYNILNITDMPFLAADGSLTLASGAVLQVAANAAVTAAKTVQIIAIGGDY